MTRTLAPCPDSILPGGGEKAMVDIGGRHGDNPEPMEESGTPTATLVLT